MSEDEKPIPIEEKELVPVINQEQAEELIEQIEGATRTLKSHVGTIIAWIAVAMSVFALSSAIVIIPATYMRGIHLGFALVLIFLLYPAYPREKEWRKRLGWTDVALSVLAVIAISYIFVDFDKFIYRASLPTNTDVLFGMLLIVLIIEAVRRSVGWHLAALVAFFFIYGLTGQRGLIPIDLPGVFGHRGYELDRLVGHVYMTLEGIFGVPLDVSSSFIILFIIYGALLDYSGAGKFFIDLSFALFGRKPAGAGRTVTFASFLLGGPSASGVATTVTLGSIAYPMLRKAGYDKENAGGLLSAGGIGAVLSPPVLGPAAFIMAEYLRISYLQVVVMSLVPTILYYLSVFLMAELDAHRFNFKEIKVATVPIKELMWKYGYHLTSLFVIVILMLYFTPILAVFWACAVAVVFSYWRKETALTPTKLFHALETAAKQVLAIAATTAAAGIIIGVFTLTGFGLKITGVIADWAGGSVFLALVFTALAIWMLGLALPISASYIIARVMTFPALVKLGVPDFAADMFIFYYAILSEVSPPVGLSPFAAAALTGGNPYKTMMMAWKYTLPAFIVPFMFTLAPEGKGLLLQGDWGNIVFATITAVVGIIALTMGAGGWLIRKASWWERIILVIAGLMLTYPSANLDLIGMSLFGVVFVYQWVMNRREKAVAA